MSKEQVEEIAKKLKAYCYDIKLNDVDDCRRLAEFIIDTIGYRKQSEGEWKPYKDYFTKKQVGWICSKCSSVRYNLSNGDTNFCPSCGARMEVGDEDARDFVQRKDRKRRVG